MVRRRYADERRLGSNAGINVPVALGSEIDWEVYDLGGRWIGRGRIDLPETGDRRIQGQDLVGLAHGVYVLVLRGHPTVLPYVTRFVKE